MPFLFKNLLAVRMVFNKRQHFTQSRRVRVTLTVIASPVPAMQGQCGQPAQHRGAQQEGRS